MTIVSIENSTDQMTAEDQVAYLNRHVSEMGVDAARRIMANVVGFALGDDQMTVIVDKTCDVVRGDLLAAGGLKGDVDVIVAAFRGVVVRECKRIAQGLSTEGGTA